MTVTPSDLTTSEQELAVDQDFDAIPPRAVPPSVRGIVLGAVDGRSPVVAFDANGPT